jgi:hypothetical protein
MVFSSIQLINNSSNNHILYFSGIIPALKAFCGDFKSKAQAYQNDIGLLMRNLSINKSIY